MANDDLQGLEKCTNYYSEGRMRVEWGLNGGYYIDVGALWRSGCYDRNASGDAIQHPPLKETT